MSPAPSLTPIFSTREELEEIRRRLHTYTRLAFVEDSVPGALMEHVLASVRGGKVLKTYDFVDVVGQATQIGWQVKSTKENTPVTWKRAKIPNSRELIDRSDREPEATQELGDAIIRFCNEHGRESLAKYDLSAIGYARLILHSNGYVTYFERELLTRADTEVFRPSDFTWRWSKQKTTRTKEQLSALHGFSRDSGEKWFAWHGRGENQLHFSGEQSWWPAVDDPHAVRFRLSSASEKVDLETLARLFGGLDAERAGR